MKKLYAYFLAVAISGSSVAQAGLLSAIKDKVTGGGEEAAPQQTQQVPAAEGTPAPAEQGKAAGKTTKSGKGKVKVVEGTPPPSTNTQPTPTREQIKAGAQKLKKAIDVEPVPKNLFQKYAGKWKGDFWVYTPSGKLEESKAASIEYTPQSDGTMKMETFYLDRISKTWVTAETATYVNDGNSVRVTIRRPNNSVSKQTGHYNDNSLFLLADISDGVEHYRERVDGKRLLVDGFGVYKGSGDQHVFIGRFLKEQ